MDTPHPFLFNPASNGPAANTRFAGKRVLIATNHLVMFSGSEVVSLELAELFHGWGARVTVYANCVSALLADQEIFRHAELAKAPRIQDYDFVWVQHLTFPLLEGVSPEAGLPLPPIVFAHLSPREPFETPFVDVENAVASLVVGNSPETVRYLRELGIEEARLKLFPNPAPRRFAFRAREMGQRPRSAVLVSNHLTDELRELTSLLRERQVRIEHCGIEGNPRRITPELLDEFDCAITIGKTVQYCLQTAMPVFCYDHFGGPGWIMAENFQRAAEHNFSGRCTGNRRTASDLITEFLDGYPAACADAAGSLRGRIPSLECWFETVLGDLVHPPRTNRLGESKWQQAVQFARLVARESHAKWDAMEVAEQLYEWIQSSGLPPPSVHRYGKRIGKPPDMGSLLANIHFLRPDLRAAFPKPFGADQVRFLSWAATFGRYECPFSEDALREIRARLRQGIRETPRWWARLFARGRYAAWAIAVHFRKGRRASSGPSPSGSSGTSTARNH